MRHHRPGAPLGACRTRSHCLLHISHAEGDRLHDGSGQLRLAGAAGDADDGPAGIGVPIGLPRPVKAGTRNTSPVSGTEAANGPISAASEMIPKPSRSHWMAAPVTKDCTLVGVGGGLVFTERPRNGREQALDGRRRLLPHVHEHEASGAIGVLGHPRGETGLPEQGALLVPKDAADGIPAPRAVESEVTPKRPLDGRTSGRADSERPTESQRGRSTRVS